MESLLKKLRERDIIIALENNNLKVKFNGDALPAELLTELKENKAKIVEYLSALNADKTDAAIQPVAPQESYPLSSSQYRMWILCQFEGASRAYNMPGVYVLEGDLSVDALEDAFLTLINRHEILRTSFRTDRQGDIRQFIHAADETGFQLAYRDLRKETETDALDNAIRSDIQYPFQLTTAPLLRACIYQVDDYKFIFTCVMHHIVSDAWSLQVLFNELLLFYNEIVKGAAPSLKPLRIQYKDYASWQDKQLRSPSFETHKKYWLQQFSGQLPVLALTADYARPAEKKYRGGRVTKRIDANTCQALKVLCRRHDVSLFMGLLSLVNLLLYRYTGQTDLIIGSPIAGRDHIDLEDQVGLYLNTLALRTTFRAEDTFEQLLAHARQVTLGAYEHQAYPFEKLVDDLNLQRDLSRSPLFDVMIILQNANIKTAQAKQQFGDIKVGSYLQAEHWVSKLDLTFDFTELEDGLQATIEYNSDLYQQHTATQWLDHLVQLTGAVLEKPAEVVSRVDYLQPEEKKTLLETFNQTAIAFPDTTIVKLLEQQVHKTPEHPALIVEDRSFTYRQLNEKVNQIADYLTSTCQLTTGDLVALQLERTEWMLLCMLGILKSGCAYVPVDPSYPQERIDYIIEDSQCKTVLNEAALLEMKEKLSRYNSHDVDRQIQSSDVAYCIYTSGTTGKPKGCLVTHGNVVSFFTGMNAVFTGEPGSLLALTNNTFDISVLELIWTLTNGYRVVLQKEVKDIISIEQKAVKPLSFSLFYFGNAESGTEDDKYKLLFEGAGYADKNGYSAVWTPERHFHEFGGLYPNPSVLGAALAAVTKNIQIRAGSVVIPLHHPIRVAEEWSVVDNISHGRAGIACASGWHVGDFVLSPGSYASRHEEMYTKIEAIQQLWKGEAIAFEDGNRKLKHTGIFPKPVQAELPIWITSANSIETFKKAGAMGGKVLTHLLGETVEGLAIKIKAYREAFAESGHDSSKAQVVLMLHTYIGKDTESTYEKARTPFMNYLRTSVGLLKSLATDLNIDLEAENYSEEDMQSLLEHAFNRYVNTASLIGTKDSCMKMLEKLSVIGVDEIACLIDFGVQYADAMESLENLTSLKDAYNARAAHSGTDYSVHAQLKKHQITHLQCTPSMAMLLKTDIPSLRSIQKLLLGGERLQPALVRELYHDLPQVAIYNMYGPTETTIWSACTHVDRTAEKVLIGKPIANTRIYILDQYRQFLPIGAEGEIYIGGKGVALHYMNKPELSAERFISDPFIPGERLYRTGDFGKWLPNGNIEYIGRRDDQVKINGHRVELREIEAALLDNELIDEAVITVREQTAGDKELIAYFVSKQPLPQEHLRMWLRNKLPQYMQPSHFVQLPKLPLTPNGKIDRQQLLVPEVLGEAEDRPYILPRNDMEEQLVRIWRELLGKDTIGVTDNFFDIGGNSIKIVRMVNMINKTTDRKITVATAFRFTTISALAEYLIGDDAVIDESTVNEVDASVDIMDRTVSLLNNIDEDR
ncbi:hypothetical protein A4H97_33920 [Niastella yeongjuensis]|uniref:Carrier domain-containing protein n=1 Tax=Niastella yeongjuensis TaxID=354355 RepID=A0A1V9EBU0_9BACT|nr:MupA/Atu3671 family FMN-dependent luciferase-like monooxygenase [Niastella yeongjuensis]OQP43590.1 hypothetical protein A4H97_33920 [Niastella yeongjuensis]SEP49363.1 natural product biosynthesis luciferase-like monooxygenase domain-containing protein [Niastella yeongjuensis]